MIDVNELCMGCFQDSGGAAVCPHCGYVAGTVQHSPICLSVGTVLNGRYLVGKTLGQGGFGITYLGLDLSSNTKVAIKEYMPDGMATRQPGSTQISVYSQNSADDYAYGMNKFLEEAKILAHFSDNPYIVRVYSFFLENGTAYFAMEYIDGMTLKAYMKANGDRLDYDETLKILTPVMLALEAVHKENFLHRDVSPDNIYIADSGAVKLLDFGAARFNMSEHSKSLSVILKPGFAPEEQYRSRGKQGPWTDIYALSATFYYCITGVTPPVSLDRMQADEIVPVFKAASLPEGAAIVLMKGLAVKADYRWQNVTDFKDALYNSKEYGTKNQIRRSQLQQQTYQQPAYQQQPIMQQTSQQPVSPYSPMPQSVNRKKSRTPVIVCAILIPIAAIIILAVIVRAVNLQSVASYVGNFSFGTIDSGEFKNTWSNIKVDLPNSWSFLSTSQFKSRVNDSDALFSDSTYTGGKHLLYDFDAQNSTGSCMITLYYQNLTAYDDDSVTAADCLHSIFDNSKGITKYGEEQTREIGGYTYSGQEGVLSDNSNTHIYYLVRKQDNYLVVIHLYSSVLNDSSEMVSIVNSIEQAN